MAQWTSLRDAVAALVRKRDHDYISGFPHLIPLAVGQSISRQEQTGPPPAHASPDLLFDPRIDRAAALRPVAGSGGAR